MRRLTVTVDEALLAIAQADVAAGRADSVSAWVADAMRAKAQARADLIADLEDLNRAAPPSAEAIDTIAKSLGRSRSWVIDSLGLKQRKRTG